MNEDIEDFLTTVMDATQVTTIQMTRVQVAATLVAIKQEGM